MHPFPPEIEHRLQGWTLFWADLEPLAGGDAALAELRRAATERARAAYVLERLAEHPVASAVRRLFRAAGCDPTRYRPSSEALLRRLLKGEELPAIHPLVDLNNALSVQLAVPACVLDPDAVAPPFELRAGAPGESMLSMRGSIDLAGKPLLADVQGPFGTPITDSERVKVRRESRRAWLVAYLPAEAVDGRVAERALGELLAAAPVARVHAAAITGR